MSFDYHDLGFAWPTRPPLFAGVTLNVAPGERLSVLGGNGSGKSTLGRCLAGALEAEGRMRWQGRDWASLSRAERASAVQLVGQRPYLQLSGRGQSLREEIAFGPENLGLPQAEIAQRVDEALAALGLTALADRDCRSLSGGETQRAILAGALAMRPALLILDEPMTDLDAESRAGLTQHLVSLPWDMAVIILDIGWHDWMAGMIQRHHILDQGRLSGALSTADLPQADLPPAILLPEALRRGAGLGRHT